MQSIIEEEIHCILDTNHWISQVLAETDKTQQIQAWYTRGDDVLISQERNGKKSYYIKDGQGSVRMLTGEDNTITVQYTYDATTNLY